MLFIVFTVVSVSGAAVGLFMLCAWDLSQRCISEAITRGPAAQGS
jgi:hypothetical protein